MAVRPQVLMFPPAGPPPPPPSFEGITGAGVEAKGSTLTVFGVPGTGPGDTVIEIADVQAFNEFALQSRLGTMEVLTSLDGVTFSPPIAMEEKDKPNWDFMELETTANRTYYFFGNFKAIRVQQSASSNVADSVLMAGKMGQLGRPR